MKRTYKLSYQFTASILIISLLLQSCGGLDSPLIPVQEGQTLGMQTHIQEFIPQVNTQPLVGQTLIAHGGHSVTFYEEVGELKTDVVVNTPQGFSKTYKGLSVAVEQGAELDNLPQLSEQAQQYHIHLQLAQGDNPAKIVIYKGAGVMGGMRREEQSNTGSQQGDRPQPNTGSQQDSRPHQYPVDRTTGKPLPSYVGAPTSTTMPQSNIWSPQSDRLQERKQEENENVDEDQEVGISHTHYGGDLGNIIFQERSPKIIDRLSKYIRNLVTTASTKKRPLDSMFEGFIGLRGEGLAYQRREVAREVARKKLSEALDKAIDKNQDDQEVRILKEVRKSAIDEDQLEVIKALDKAKAQGQLKMDNVPITSENKEKLLQELEPVIKENRQEVTSVLKAAIDKNQNEVKNVLKKILETAITSKNKEKLLNVADALELFLDQEDFGVLRTGDAMFRTCIIPKKYEEWRKMVCSCFLAHFDSNKIDNTWIENAEQTSRYKIQLLHQGVRRNGFYFTTNDKRVREECTALINESAPSNEILQQEADGCPNKIPTNIYQLDINVKLRDVYQPSTKLYLTIHEKANSTFSSLEEKKEWLINRSHILAIHTYPEYLPKQIGLYKEAGFLKEAGIRWEKAVKWDSKNQDKEELKKLLAAYSYIMFHAAPFKRGSASIIEWSLKAIAKYHGYKIGWLSWIKIGLTPDQIALSTPFIDEFIDKFKQNVDIEKL